MVKKTGYYLTFFVLFVISMFLNPIIVKASEVIAEGNCGISGDNVKWNLTADGVLTISGTGAMADYEPDNGDMAYNNFSPWNSYKKTIKKITISGVSTIGEYAFYRCKESEVFFADNSVVKIKRSAFEQNNELEIINLPQRISYYGDCAFSETEKLKLHGLELKNVSYIGGSAFGIGSIDGDVYISGDINGISSNAFNAKDMRYVKIGEGITNIGALAFGFNPQLRIDLPSTITFLETEWGWSHVDIIYGSNDYCKNYAFMEGKKYFDLNKTYNLTEATGDLEIKTYQYMGEEIKPNVPVLNYLYTDDKCGDVTITLLEGIDYSVSYSNNIDIGKAYITLTGMGVFEGSSKTFEFEINENINNCDTSIEYDSVLYDGTEKKPSITVKNKDKILTEGTDYSITYSNNIEEGQATVNIAGKGFYKGEISKSFSIYKKDITLSAVKLPYTEVLYDGKAKEPKISVKFDGTDLLKDKDYSVSYKDNVDVGKATVTVTGKGSFKGEVKKEFSIYKYDLTKADISQSFTEVLYDGNAKLPDITVKYENKELTKDTDYSVEVSNNINPGVVTFKIVGLNQYSGTVDKQFEIKGLSIENADVLLKESIYSYDGSPKTPPVEVKLGDKTLVKDTDYTLAYENNINDGTAHVVVTGIGIYTDVIKASFIILPYNAGMDSVYPEGTMIDGDFAYGVTDDEKNEVELFCPASQNVKNIQIPATITDENGTVYTVTSIGNKAFYKNTKITGVTIANTVKSIEDYAFYGCKNIKTIKMGSGVELIGNSAFRKCTKLTSIILPKSLDQLGKNVFYGCSKLKTITINAKSVVDIKANAIKGISKKAVIKVPSKLVKKYKKEFDKKSGFKGGMKVKKK